MRSGRRRQSPHPNRFPPACPRQSLLRTTDMRAARIVSANIQETSDPADKVLSERKDPTDYPGPGVPMAKVILTVDDSTSVRQMVRFTLSDGGYTVIEAVDGKDALDKLTKPVNLVITDLNMPNLD